MSPSWSRFPASKRSPRSSLARSNGSRNGCASPGRLYGADEIFEEAEFAEPIKGEKVQFRFIVSPEDGREVDLRTFTRELMAQMEADLGRPLIWTAVNHHNTDHPHAHVVVRGVDRDGKELRIPSRYIKQDMRARAEQIMTRELGLRTELDIAQQRSNEIGQERLTSIDRQLARLPDGRWRIPPDLVRKLQARETTHPRHRLRVHYAGASVQTQPTRAIGHSSARPSRAR